MIKFLDLQKINSKYAEELKQAAAMVIDSGWYLHGEQITRFEKNLSEYLGVTHVIGVANGLDALRLIFKAYIESGKLKEGDEVIVPANTFIASVLAITDNRLVPVFAEPDPHSFNLDHTKIQKHISSKTKAILVVHLYGQVCWSEELELLAKQKNLLIVEDNAQAIGAVYSSFSSPEKRKTGALGNAAGLSFYPGKNLGALGDSGAVSTNDDELARLIRALGNYGSQFKYYCDYKGLNSRMNEIQAAFLTVKLKYLDEENQRRKEIALQYQNNIHHSSIVLPKSGNADHVWHLFVVRCKEREILRKYLDDKGIQTQIHYPIPPHKQKSYKEFGNLSFPITEEIHNQVLSLPISPCLTDSEIGYVIDCINTF